MANYRAIGGGNIAVRYEEIAVAASGQTYAQQLAQLKTTWDTLTDEQKLRCMLLVGGLTGDQYMKSGTATFTRTTVSLNSNKVFTLMFIISSQKFYYAENNTITDFTNVNNDNALRLMMLCNY